MPIYEYRCSSCGHELEALQKFSDAPLTVCPSCNAEALVKLLSAAGFQLKGSGWYATDFKGGGKPAPTQDGGESKPDAKSELKGESKSESKSESKAESKGDSKGESKGGTKAGADKGSKSEAGGGGTPPASPTGATPASS